MYSRFGLTLMVNHACNLRCLYCYTGTKFMRRMSEAVGMQAIDRAVSSLEPCGTLELGFFGGEPLLEAELMSAFILHARARCRDASAALRLSLTTNGTVDTSVAWPLLTLSDLDLAISHDGLPAVHDKNRPGSSAKVLETMQRLHDTGKDFRVVMVVRPDNLNFVTEGIEFLRGRGVRRFDLSLDLWTNWTREDSIRLEQTIVRCARLWRKALPNIALSWFDEKAALLSRAPASPTARCSFGAGQIAVAPSGRLYPCERLIGEDHPDNPMQLPGYSFEGRSAAACTSCAMQELCNTTCRCSNYVRTGHTGSPDGLLCMFNQVCLRETVLALRQGA
jgi:uncharacterized protein